MHSGRIRNRGDSWRLAWRHNHKLSQVERYRLPAFDADGGSIGFQRWVLIAQPGNEDERGGFEAVTVGIGVEDLLRHFFEGYSDGLPYDLRVRGAGSRKRHRQVAGGSVRVGVVGEDCYVHVLLSGGLRPRHDVILRDRWEQWGVRVDGDSQRADRFRPVRVADGVLDDLLRSALGCRDEDSSVGDRCGDPSRDGQSTGDESQGVTVGVAVVGENVDEDEAFGSHDEGVVHGNRRLVLCVCGGDANHDLADGGRTEMVGDLVGEGVRAERGGVGQVVEPGLPDSNDPSFSRCGGLPNKGDGVAVGVDSVKRNRDPDGRSGECPRGHAQWLRRVIPGERDREDVDGDLSGGATSEVVHCDIGSVHGGRLRGRPCLEAQIVAGHEQGARRWDVKWFGETRCERKRRPGSVAVVS